MGPLYSNLKSLNEFFFVVLLIPYWVGLIVFSSNLPVLPIDLLAIVILLRGRNNIQTIFYALFLASSAIITFENKYFFGGISELFISILSIKELNLSIFSIFWVAVVVIAVISCAYFIFRSAGNSLISLKLFVFITAFAVAIDFLNGSFFLSNTSSRASKFNYFGSPLVTAVRSEISTYGHALLNDDEQPKQAIAQLQQTYQWAKDHENGSVLFLLIESMGVPRDPWLNGALFQPLQLPENRQSPTVHISIDYTQSKGSTITNEFRFLCGRWVSIAKAKDAQKGDCAGNILSGLGFRTIGMHGFSSRMFNRSEWWHGFGLQQTWFEDHWLEQSKSSCGTLFRGACDVDLIQSAFEAITWPRTFSYALTLNTHLPLDKFSPAADAAFFSTCISKEIDPNVCQLIGMQRELFRQIVASASEQRIPTWIVVTGDHPPPFTSFVQVNAFLKNLVPIVTIEILPRDAAIGLPTQLQKKSSLNFRHLQTHRD